MIPIVFVWIEPHLYTPLDRKPKRDDDWHALRRVRNIETNGRVSVVIDRYDEDWRRLEWLMLEGTAEIIEAGAERDRAVAGLEAKYAQYERLSLDGCPVVKVTVEKRTAWSAA